MVRMRIKDKNAHELLKDSSSSTPITMGLGTVLLKKGGSGIKKKEKKKDLLVSLSKVLT